jgi:hypothetical protein
VCVWDWRGGVVSRGSRENDGDAVMIYRRHCPAGVWTKVIFDFGRGYAEDRRVKISVTDGGTFTGCYREVHYNWIIPQKPIEGDLRAEMLFQRRWIDGIYSVSVKPDKDIEFGPA